MNKNPLQDILNRSREHRKENSKIDDPAWVNRSLSSKTANEETYGQVKWILRSPGNDLLEFYDQQNILLGNTNRAYSAIPPSLVYHYRFEHRYPKELFDKSKNYGINSYLRDQLKHLFVAADKTYWAQVRTTRYDWLVDNPHTSIEFKYRHELIQYLKDNFDQDTFHFKVSVHKSNNKLKEFKSEYMIWRGKLKGWSIIVVPK